MIYCLLREPASVGCSEYFVSLDLGVIKGLKREPIRGVETKALHGVRDKGYFGKR